MGPNSEHYARLDRSIRRGLGALGLEPGRHLKVLKAEQIHELEAKGYVVGLWYGGPQPWSEVDLKMLASLLKMGTTIFPLVKDVNNDFQNQVPAELGPINGLNWNDARLPADVLKAFGLTRVQRQVFISYKRTDSAGVAKQLAEALFNRGYTVFLDTAAVERGVPFQEVLRDRLADTDLVILLDSPNVRISSKWVAEELNLASCLGLGILQMVWDVPGTTSNRGVGETTSASPGTEFCMRFRLKKTDFDREWNQSRQKARLLDRVVARAANQAEQARIRSLGAKRMRVVSYLQSEAARSGFGLTIQPGGPVKILQGKTVVAETYPIPGHPDAPLVYEHYMRKLTSSKPDLESSTLFATIGLVFDGLGLQPRHFEFLKWLNTYIPLKTVRTEELHEWLVAHGTHQVGTGKKGGFGIASVLPAPVAKGPILLGVGVPVRNLDRFEPDPVAVRDAVRALVAETVRDRVLVCGGHEAIAILVLATARSLGTEAERNVHFFISDYFEKTTPQEIQEFPNRTVIGRVRGGKTASLNALRDQMIGSREFSAAFFIGGMSGVEREWTIFQDRHPHAPAFPVASTEGASRSLWEHWEPDPSSSPPNLKERLAKDLDYRMLFRDLLGNPPPGR